MIDFTHNPIIPADYKSRGRGLPYEASPLGGSLLYGTKEYKKSVPEPLAPERFFKRGI